MFDYIICFGSIFFVVVELFMFILLVEFLVKVIVIFECISVFMVMFYECICGFIYDIVEINF